MIRRWPSPVLLWNRLATGTRIVIVVPRPGLLTIETAPPTAAARSCMMDRPRCPEACDLRRAAHRRRSRRRRPGRSGRRSPTRARVGRGRRGPARGARRWRSPLVRSGSPRSPLRQEAVPAPSRPIRGPRGRTRSRPCWRRTGSQPRARDRPAARAASRIARRERRAGWYPHAPAPAGRSRTRPCRVPWRARCRARSSTPRGPERYRRAARARLRAAPLPARHGDLGQSRSTASLSRSCCSASFCSVMSVKTASTAGCACHSTTFAYTRTG